jgi:hypothetical protein
VGNLRAMQIYLKRMAFAGGPAQGLLPGRRGQREDAVVMSRKL